MALPSVHSFSTLCAALPTPIAFVLDEFFREGNAFVALWRMVDAAEIITRFFTITVLSDILRQKGEFPEPVQDALTEKLERPTFGAWKELLAIAIDNLLNERGQTHCFVSELPSFVRDKWIPALGSGEDKPEEKLIALRNLVAHAGRLPDEKAQELLNAHRQRFESLVKDLVFLADYALIACTKEGQIVWLKGLPDADGSFPNYDRPLSFVAEHGRVYLVHDGEGLDLFPLHAFTDILQWREERYDFESLGEVAPQIYFRLSERGYLECIPFSTKAVFSHLGKDAYQRFRDIFRLEEWRAQRRRKAEAQGIQKLWDELVRELTEVFVGREEHIRQVKEAIKRTSKGILWISGKPGVGKSALMAKLMQDYIGQTQHYIVIPYFFRYGQAGCSTMDFLATALKRLQAELNRTIELEPRFPDRQQQLVEALEEAASKTSKKVLFLVDGLDEIYRHEREFLNVPFMTIRERILWVCAGRSEGDLEETLKSRGAEWVFPDGLPSLDEQAIRAMLVEHLGRLKYALFERDEGERNRFVEAVTHKSEGLPLYARMVIEDLKAGRLTVWDEEKLPKGLVDYYERLLERLRVSDVGTVLTPLFCLLAWAKEPITEETMNFLLQIHYLAGTSGWGELFRRALEHGHLMLQQRPTPDGETGWTIYHDSFRQHLLESGTVSDNREWAQWRWLKVCEDWKALASQEPSLHRYILRHYAEHLLETKQYDKLWQLAQNEEFAARQREILPDEPGLSLYTLRLALDGAIQMEEPAVMSEMLLRHAKQVWGETPLQAWHRNEKKRAFMLADLVFDHDHQLGTISFLLLAWVAHLDNEAEWVETCLEKICQRWDEEDFPKLSGEPDKWEEWQGSIAVFLLGELGMVTASVKTAQMIMDDDTKCMMVEAWTEHGFIDAAITIAREMIKKSTEERSKWLGVSGLGVIAEMLTRSQQSEYAHQVLEEALKSSKNIREAIWRSLALATVAKSLAKSGHIERAKELFNEALKVAQGIQDKIWRFLVLQKLAIILAKQGDIERTIQIFEQVIKTAEREKDIRWRLGMLKPLPVSLAKAGLIDRALEVVQSIEEIDPFGWVSSIVLCEIVEVLAEERQLDQALKVSETISDERQRFKAMVAIVEALAKLGEVNRAREIAEEIEEEKERARALASVAVALAKEEQVDQALKIINENIKELDKRCKALAMLAEALARMRQIEWAKQIFGEVLEVAGGYEKVEWSSIALKEASEVVAEAMGEAMIEVGLIDALKVAQNMKGVEQRSKALAAFAEELVKEGPTHLLLVRQIFDTLEVAENAMEAWSLGRELRKMTKAMAESGQLAQSLAQSFELAEGLAGAIGKEQGHARALREEAISLARQGQFDEALKLIETFEVADERSAVMAAIVIGLSKAGHVKEAIKIAESLEQEEMRSWILASTCAVLVRAREMACAEEVAARIHKLDEAASAWLAISKGWAIQEELDKAEIALNKAYHFAQEGGSHWQLWRLAAAYAEIGFGDKAVALAKLLPLEREKYLPIVLDALVDRGDKTNFLLLLPLCCWNLILAYRACACLTQFYPSQAKQIATLIEYG